MGIQLTIGQAIQTLRLVHEKLEENKQQIKEARATTLGDLMVPVLERYNDDLVSIREKITGQLEFDEEVEM
jgi:hypothetical protein